MFTFSVIFLHQYTIQFSIHICLIEIKTKRCPGISQFSPRTNSLSINTTYNLYRGQGRLQSVQSLNSTILDENQKLFEKTANQLVPISIIFSLLDGTKN